MTKRNNDASDKGVGAEEERPTEPVAGNEYADPLTEQELRADLEEIWQGESPATARRTDFADEVDGRLGTRHSIPGPGE